MPHTGTVFTRYVLECFGLKDKRAHADGDYMSHHTNEFWGHGIANEGKLIVPLRDPMLAEITRVRTGWGMPIEHWTLLGDVDAHFLRVQPPGPWFSPPIETLLLAAYLEREEWPNVDWTPRNTRGPHLMKEAYSKGIIPGNTRRAWDWLTQSEDAEPVHHIFETHGYELPWM